MCQKKIIIGSDSGLSPSWCQALIWTNAWNIVNSTPRNKLQWNINRNSCIFIRNWCHEQAVMKLWHVTNIIGMSIHKELLIAICTMHYVAISIRVCEISLWRPLRHATGGSKGCRSGLSDRQPSVPPVLLGLWRRRPMCHCVEVEPDILNYLCMLKWAIIAQVVSCNQGWGQVLFEVLESSTSTFSYLQVQVQVLRVLGRHQVLFQSSTSTLATNNSTSHSTADGLSWLCY